MVEQQNQIDPTPVFVAATTAYVINCALGAGVASGIVRTGRFRWIHHALYVTTCVLGASAASSVLWSRSSAGWRLLPAAVPLAIIPYVPARSARHPALALSAAPFFLSSLSSVRR